MPNTIYNLEPTQPASLPKRRWLGDALTFCLISAATAAMMLCPCDVVTIHDHYAISLIALATAFTIAAACLLYRRMSPDSGMTAFLRAVVALAIAGVSVYLELFIAMEIIAWTANRH